MKAIKPTLVFACGNPSRGDDALGPELISRLELECKQQQYSNKVDFLTDFQFQIEHAIDLKDRQRVIFVDASLSSTKPFAFEAITAEKDSSHTTHSMSPQAVMDVYRQMYQEPPPPCFLLSIRGVRFELGEPISAAAEYNLERALEFISKNLT